jgi:hypothetical protein
MADSKNKKNAAVAAAVTPEPVKVKVYRPTPNRYLLQVQVPTGEAGTMRVALLRVRDSRFYRPGEMIPLHKNFKYPKFIGYGVGIKFRRNFISNRRGLCNFRKCKPENRKPI